MSEVPTTDQLINQLRNERDAEAVRKLSELLLRHSIEKDEE